MNVAAAALLQALSDAELTLLTAAGVFERGRDLFRTGGVTRCEHGQDGAVNAAKARVRASGRQPYTVQLTHSVGSRLRGGCDCMYAADGSVCKHQIALALAWRASLAASSLDVPAVPDSAQPAQPPNEPDWMAFVRQQSAPALVAKLLHWAEQVPEIRQDLQAWQRAATPVADAAAAKKVVTALLAAPRDLIEWRKVGAYVRKAQAVLGVLQGWTATDPAMALVAADWALHKLRKVWEMADDANGEIGELMRELADHWLTALQAAGVQPAAFGDKVDKLWGDDDHALFDQAAALAAMGSAAATRYGERVQAAWALAQHSDDTHGPRSGAKRRLQDYHRASADPAAEVELLRASLKGDADHIDLIQALQRQGRAREALQAAEAAHRSHPTQRAIEDLLLQCYEADGWDAEALALRRAAFAREPSAARYQAVLVAAQMAGEDPVAERERLWAQLDAQDGRVAGFLTSWLGAVRLDIWAAEGRFADALDWLSAPRNLSPESLRNFARALPAAYDAQAADLYKQALALRMPQASNPYAEELRLVRSALERLAPEAAQLWRAWLKLEYRHKPRFVEGLSGL